ncbi:MAG: hypothetical protein ABSF13_02930 [Smithella sp.]
MFSHPKLLLKKSCFSTFFLFHGFPVVAVEVVVALIAFGPSSYLGHPNYFVSPNAYSFPMFSSSVELVGGVLFVDSIDSLSNDSPCSYSSNRRVHFDKKMDALDSGPNLNHSSASGTIALPTDATTNHHRKKCPHLR